MVVAHGTDGVSAPMFPIVPEDLDPAGGGERELLVPLSATYRNLLSTRRAYAETSVREIETLISRVQDK